MPVPNKALVSTNNGSSQLLKHLIISSLSVTLFKSDLLTRQIVFLLLIRDIISNLRQINSLKESYDSINRVIDSIDNEMPEDFLSIDLLSAYASLGEIIGEEVSDDLVDKIFSEFCMGK